MAIHNVLVKRQSAYTNVDSFNRTAVCTQDLDNGDVFKLIAYSTNKGQSEVWQAVQGTADNTVSSGFWIAETPEVNITTAGDESVGAGILEFRGITVDPRLFTNVANRPFDAKLLTKGDILSFTGDGITNIATSPYLISQAGSFKLVGADEATAKALIETGNGLVMRKIENDRIPIGGTRMLGQNGATSYKFEVVFNA